MPKLKWDQIGERRFETGVDRGVLYLPSATGKYDRGFAWNGLTAVTESPSGAESNKQYADNIVYLNLVSVEEFAGTIEAFTYPPQFAICNGEKNPAPGVAVGQQSRSSFGLAYRTKVGNDLKGQDAGYKIHMVWGALAAPSERAYATVNESPEAMTFSWEISTTPVGIELEGYRPTASITIDSTEVAAAALGELETILWGGAAAAATPQLPTPTEVVTLFADALGTP